MRHLHRTLGLWRGCSGARTLARRVPTRPRVPRSGDFPQRPAVADADHRQLPSTSWQRPESVAGGNTLPLAAGKGEKLPCGRSAVPRTTPTAAAVPETASGGPSLVPCLLLRRGTVCLPGPEGPVPVRRRSGAAFDVFDVIDRLSPQYPLLYFADLDGLERNDPQLEYIQELSRDMPLWVDSGVRRADQAIDVIVAGAQKAVLSSAYLQGPRELRRAWRLSTELVFELETIDGRLESVDPGWQTNDPLAIVRAARGVGVDSVVLSPREADPDWSLVASIAAEGPTWVDGTFSANDVSRLAEVKAAGGIFHLDGILASMDDT